MSFEVPDWDNSEAFSYYNTPSLDTLNIVKKVEGQKGKRNLSDITSDQAVKKPKISFEENTPGEVLSLEDKKKAKKKRQKELAAERKKNEAEKKQPNDTAAANENGLEVTSEKKEKKCKNKYKQLSLEQRKKKEIENGGWNVSDCDRVGKQMSNGTEATENFTVISTQKNKKRKNADVDNEPITVNSVQSEEIQKKTKKEKKKKTGKQLNGTVIGAVTVSESPTNKEESPKKRKKKNKKKDEQIADALAMAGNHIEETQVNGEETEIVLSSKKKNKKKAEKKLNGNAQANEVLANNKAEDKLGPFQKKKQKKKKKNVDKNEEEEPVQKYVSEQKVTETKMKGQKNKETKSTGKNKENAKKKDKTADGKGKSKSQKEKKKKITEEDFDEAENINDPTFQSDFDDLLKKLNFEQLPADILTLKDSDVKDMDEESEDLAESDIDTDDILSSTDEEDDDDDDEGEEYDDDEEEEDNDDDDDDEEEEDNNVQRNLPSIQKQEAIPKTLKGMPAENQKKVEAKSEASVTRELQVPKKEEKSNKLARKEADKETKTSPNKEDAPMSSAEALRQKMMDRLKGAQFRMMNEQLYTKTSKNAVQKFKDDTEAFERYHEGFQTQVALWPINPLDTIITWIKKKPRDWVIADFGCGEAKLAASVPQTQVHSFDLVAVNERVTPCDMANTPLKASSVDVVVFCLSLMGTNVKDFLIEANRVLKNGGIMKIAEVESRFIDVHKFVKAVSTIGFDCINKEIKQKYFHKFDFRKISNCNKGKVPNIELKPCIYKKR